MFQMRVLKDFMIFLYYGVDLITTLEGFVTQVLCNHWCIACTLVVRHPEDCHKEN